jgi:hypothetical protein
MVTKTTSWMNMAKPRTNGKSSAGWRWYRKEYFLLLLANTVALRENGVCTLTAVYSSKQ